MTTTGLPATPRPLYRRGAMVSLGTALLLTVAMSTSSTAATTPSRAAGSAYLLAPAATLADSHFSDDGKQTTDFGGGSDNGHAVVVQPDGKTLVAGTVDSAGGDLAFGIARYNTDGSLDPTFSDDGKQLTDFSAGNDEANAVALDGDKILVAGHSENNFAIARYNANGTLDNSFSGDGMETTVIGSSSWGNGVAVQANGKIVVGGAARDDGTSFAVARYNDDGSLDLTFDDDGIQTTQTNPSIHGDEDYGHAVAIQADQKIVVAGESGSHEFAVVRYNSDGSLDTSFSGDGIQTTAIGVRAAGVGLAIGRDGIVVAGSAAFDDESSDLAVVRYDAFGEPDHAFSGDGVQTTHHGSYTYGNGLALQLDGRIVVGGVTTQAGEVDFALARYDADGTPDGTLSGDGFQTTDFGSGDVAFGTAVGPDAKIVLAGVTYGSGDFAVARYNTDGSLDATPSPPAPTPPAPSIGCTITGTPGNDVIHGTPGRDIICAGRGNDLIYARGGNDLVYGGRGADRLRGGTGSDVLHGGRGGDRLRGRAGNDVLHGGRGPDRLFGGTGSDVLRGGPRGDHLDTRDHVGRNDVADGDAGNDSCRTDSRDRRRSC
jgi:uncharacterized delta-60 repeat protein